MCIRDSLMMLNFAAYVFAFLAYYAVGYAFQFGAVAINAAPTNLCLLYTSRCV